MILKDKTVLIYGAVGAVGGALARAFAREGARLFLSSRRLDPVQKLADEIRSSGGTVEAAEVNALEERETESSERAQTLAWMFAALSTVEPPVNQLAVMDLQFGEEEWAKLGRPVAEAAVHKRLEALSTWLQGRNYLLGRFSAADILMATVLRLIRHTQIVAGYGPLAAYLARCQARVAFQKALHDQLADYTV